MIYLWKSAEILNNFLRTRKKQGYRKAYYPLTTEFIYIVNQDIISMIAQKRIYGI